MRGRTERILLAAGVLGAAILVWLVLTEAPSFEAREGFTAPISWKLFFFHVPLALVGFLAFALALGSSIQYLRRQEARSDHNAHASVEVGVVYTGLTLATGMIWGKAEWGVAWRWSDPKLVVVLVLFLVYLAYLALRREIADPGRRARLSALYALAAFAAVPLAWFAQRIWDSFHPTVFGTDAPEAGVTTPGVMPLFVLAVLVFLALFLAFQRWRAQILADESRVEELSVAEEVP